MPLNAGDNALRSTVKPPWLAQLQVGFGFGWDGGKWGISLAFGILWRPH